MKFTYFAFSAARGLKIGKSINPVVRIKQINCGSNEFADFFALEETVLLEKQAHALFREYRIAGEFFDLSLERAREVLVEKGFTEILSKDFLKQMKVLPKRVRTEKCVSTLEIPIQNLSNAAQIEILMVANQRNVPPAKALEFICDQNISA